MQLVTYLLPGSEHPVVRPFSRHGPSILRDLFIATWLVADHRDKGKSVQGRPTYNAPKLGVIVDMARIQVVAQSAFEHGGILRDDSETSTKISQPNCRHIEPINTEILLT